MQPLETDDPTTQSTSGSDDKDPARAGAAASDVPRPAAAARGRGGSGRSRDYVRPRLPTSPFAVRPAEPPVAFEVDDRVTHDRHGLGRVKAVNGGQTVDVDFGRDVGVLRVDTTSKRIHRL